MRRGIGRPAKAEPFRSVVAEILAGEPDLLSVEILRRAKFQGYTGEKTALYDLVPAIRPWRRVVLQSVVDADEHLNEYANFTAGPYRLPTVMVSTLTEVEAIGH